ncbi:SDR family oxidoreductase [Pseudorhodoplanes sinuspersici]|uniref:Short-chain dehydrogenase/reductase n=1 Tax=Pseudorhodoplanes sinuspersici TaxID=1235591 RepID=A0A1W6ZVP0_9HYPH|nr:SDR family oxidoreductase [Pseudorhodoplanes sinuspersici]ARQ01499.1 short-chain dehydrogenase/reductase [Pseudorhodoplanes sinuspersici]RKE73199.1 short-subunit dehydrogenase [Pseudorhodoplanes sinuspersici]
MSAPSKSAPVLITGCSSGLGEATALLFREAGFLTIATARDPLKLKRLAAAGCETLPLDVTDEISQQAVVRDVTQRHGPVGVLINNAGYGQYGPLEEVSPELVRRAFETNVFGLLRMSQLVMPGMRRAGRGRIVNISSLAGRVTAQGGGVYHMTKYAVEALADAMRAEVKPFGVDLVNVLPGPFVSPYRDKVIGNIPDMGPDSPYRIYSRNVGAYMLHFLDPKTFGTMPLDKVARVVFKAGTTPRPRTRYNVGFWAHFGPVGRYLASDRVVDWWMSRKIPHDVERE